MHCSKSTATAAHQLHDDWSPIAAYASETINQYSTPKLRGNLPIT
jgi:hypothetical protein